MQAPKRPILRYHGGKWKLAKWIISQFPKHRKYVEPYGGAASVLLQKERVYAEVYNDLWDEVVNVFRVLQDPLKAERLEQLLKLTPFARSEFEYTYTAIPHSDIEKARLTIFRSFAAFGSGGTNPNHKTGFRKNSDRPGTTPAHDWMNYPAQIKLFSERLQGVVLEKFPAITVMKSHDTTETLHFVDPPYMHDTRYSGDVYAYEMNGNDHAELANCLHNLKGMVVLAGYSNDLYADLYKGWETISRKAHADGARPRIETLWFNPAATEARKAQGIIQQKLFA